jgi:hypothetical protein
MATDDPIQADTHEGALRLTWDYRTAATDVPLFCILLVFWLIWAPATLFVTCLLSYVVFFDFHFGKAAFFAVWLLFGWLGTLAIPLTLLQRFFFAETIEISKDEITYRCKGFLASKPKTYPVGTICEIGLGRYGDETMVTLNVVCGDRFSIFGRKRHMIGYWLAPKLRRQVFKSIKTFVEAHKISVPLTNYDEKT